MTKKQLSLGIDTSNYKTSVAVVDAGGKILFNSQNFLYVKEGERGLRQSDAFFQHVKKLPSIFEEVFAIPGIRENIGSISVSSRPRPVEGSYMPVFMAGQSFASALSSALNVPLYEFSHQEGHVEAVKYYSKFKDSTKLATFHFSGGTTEALLVDLEQNTFEIVGGTKDLAYGQVLDRVGVALGLQFPCGEELDEIAIFANYAHKKLSKIKVSDCFVNLSGIETQAQRLIGEIKADELVCELFDKICASIKEMTMQISSKYDVKDFLFAGGVSSSGYMRNYLKNHLPKDINFAFGEPKLSSDNAVGIALLGGKEIWL